MAIAKNGILGGFSGSVGDIIGANWKGVNTIRSKSAIPKKTLTAKQKKALEWSHLVLQMWQIWGISTNVFDLKSNKIGDSPMNVFQKKCRPLIMSHLTTNAQLVFLIISDYRPYSGGYGAPFSFDTTYTYYDRFSEELKNDFTGKFYDFVYFQVRMINGMPTVIQSGGYNNFIINKMSKSFTITCKNEIGDRYYYISRVHEPNSDVLLYQYSNVSVIRY